MNKRMKRIVLLGVCLAPFIGFVSTTNAIKGLAAPPALYFDLNAKARDWQSYSHAALSGPAAARAVADTLAPSRESICLTARLEETDGIVTGAAGKGATSAALASACAAMTAIDATLQDAAQRNDERRTQAAQVAETLLDIPERDDLGIFERQKAFDDALAPLKDALADARNEKLRETVRAQTAILAASVATLETQEGAFGDTQRAAVAALKSQLQDVQGTLNGFLDEIAQDADVDPPAPLLSSGEAIAQWWPRLLPQILAAVGVDLAILWVAGFLAVSRASIRDMKDALEKPRPRSITIKAANSNLKT